MDMKVMKFDTFEWHKGLNVTVRLADKWHKLLFPGEQLVLENSDGSGRIEAVVLFTQVMAFKDVPDVVLSYEHSSGARTKQGLWNELKRAYGDIVNKESLVTVVGFVVS